MATGRRAERRKVSDGVTGREEGITKKGGRHRERRKERSKEEGRR